MKRKTAIVLAFFLVKVLCAQNQLNKLRTPSSPAASILELQPKTILEPKSYQALETAIYSNFLNSNNISIPSDFSLEFTPYWTKNHKLGIKEYLYPEKITDHFIRNASFSLSSTQNFILGDSSRSNAIGIGFRTSFYIPNKADIAEVDSKIDQIRANQRAQSTIGSQITPYALSENSFEDFWDKTNSTIKSFIKRDYHNYLTEEELELLVKDLYIKGKELTYDKNSGNSAFIQSFMNLIDLMVGGEKLYSELKNYIENRYGLTIDIAYSNFISFPTNDFEYSMLPKQALWVTPSYKFKDNLEFLKALIVLRYEWYDTDYYERFFEDSTFFRNNLDYGISLVGEFDKFSIQFEMVGRKSYSEIPAGMDSNNNPLFRKENKSDFQYIGTFSYSLTDQINLFYSLGNKFENVSNNPNTLVSLIGLSLGFGTPDKSDLDLSKL